MGVLVTLVLWKEIRRQVRTPHRLVIWLALPIVLTTIMGLAFGGWRTGSGEQITVAIVEQDRGWLGRMLGVFLEAATNDFVSTRMLSREEAERSLRTEMELAGMVVIPEGALNRLLEGKEMEIIWTPNPRMTIYPAVVHEVLQQFVGMARGFTRAFRGPVAQIREIEKAGDREAQSRAISEAFRQRFESLGRGWFPPAVLLKVERPAEEKQSPFLFDIFRMVFSPLMLYSLFFVCQGLMRSWMRERNEGTLARVLASPVSFTRYYLSVQVASLFFAVLVACVLMVFGILAYQLVPAHPGSALLSVVVSVWFFISLISLLYGLARTERGAGAFAELLGTLFAVIGGVFFPIPPDSGFLSRISEFSFMAWGARALSYAMNGDVALQSRWGLYLLYLVIGGIILEGLAVFAVRRKLLAGAGRVYA